MPHASAQSTPSSGQPGVGSPWRGERAAHAALAVITLLGALLRAWRIDELWLSADEAIYYFSTLGDWASAQQSIQENAHPPLYYWVLYGLARIAGSIEALRSTALVPGVLCIPACYWLARSYAGRTAALAAAGLVALSPGAQFLSQVMRPYSAQLLFLLLALGGLARWLATSRTRWLVVHSLCGLVATFLQYSAFIVHAGVAACALGLWLARELDLRRARALVLAELPILAGMAWLYLSHIRPSLVGSEVQANVRESYLERGFLTSPAQLGGALEDVLAYLFGRPTDFALYAALSIGLVVCARRRLWAPLLLASGTIAAALLLSFLGQYPLLGHRHCLYLLAVLAPLAGIALEALLHAPRRGLRWLGVALLLAVAAGLANVPRILERRWRGAERAPTYAMVERVRAELDGERLADAVLLTDRATATLLSCLYRERTMDLAALAGGPVHALQAGGHRFYCLLGEYRMRAERESRHEPNHLAQLLDGLESLAADGHVPALDERVWIVQSGYGRQAHNVLPETLGDGTFLRSPRIGAFWFSLFQLDHAAYRRYLAE